MEENNSPRPGWYQAPQDPAGAVRYWDGLNWVGDSRPAEAPRNYDNSAPEDYQRKGLASPWERLGARIVDGLILIVPIIAIYATSFLLDFPGSAIFDSSGGIEELIIEPGILTPIFAGLVSLGYEFYFLAFKDGATIGKRTLNIKVTKETGESVDEETVIKRLALAAIGILPIPIFSQILGLIVGLGTIIMIFVDKRRQTPADKVAKTIVVKS